VRQIFVNLPVKDLERSRAFFASRTLAEAKRSTEVLIALSCVSDEEVRDLVARAAQSGGKPEHAFEDPDGHIWELVHMRSQP
jgi:uncharacterized protein